MDKPTEARLAEIAEQLGTLHEEVRGWEASDFEWLAKRIRASAEEARFMIQMRFGIKPGKTGLSHANKGNNPN